MQHTEETRVLCIGPNSTRSGIMSADENRMTTGPNLRREEDSLPNEENIHHAPIEMSKNWQIRAARSTLKRCFATTRAG